MANISTELAAIMSAIYGEEVRGSIHDAIEKINNVVDSSDQAHLMNSIAPTYDTVNTSTKYNVGDYVFRADGSGRLYMCQTATTGGIEFSGSNWTEVPIATLLSKYVEVNQFRFDSSTSIPIIKNKTCDELTSSNVWYVWCSSGTPVVTDFPIKGPGWIRVTATGARIVQQVYPSDLLKFPYRLIRTRDGRDANGNSSLSSTVWSDWYKIPYKPEASESFIELDLAGYASTDPYVDSSLGITYTFTDVPGKFHASGTATSSGGFDFYNSGKILPGCIKGGTSIVPYISSDKVSLMLYETIGTSIRQHRFSKADGNIYTAYKLPSGLTGIGFGIRIEEDVTIDEDVIVHIWAGGIADVISDIVSSHITVSGTALVIE